VNIPEEYIEIEYGTLKRKDPSPVAYDQPYWGVDGHSEIQDQCFNVHGYKNEAGITKTEAVLQYCKGSTLLEIGCAPGAFLREARKRGFFGIGIEPCEEHIPFIEEHSRCMIYHGFFEDFEIPGLFDTIVAMDVLEHVPDPQRFIEKAISQLKEGGRIVLMLPAIYDDGEFDERQFHPEHLHLFSQEHLRKWLDPIIFDRWIVGHEIVVLEPK
jgi:2-polyprenyl-3-methyl-5-hydroxy-6-metoxy-1,4-benzoquinol methylase